MKKVFLSQIPLIALVSLLQFSAIAHATVFVIVITVSSSCSILMPPWRVLPATGHYWPKDDRWTILPSTNRMQYAPLFLNTLLQNRKELHYS